jgi:Xaa-Pro aminopeptidase
MSLARVPILRHGLTKWDRTLLPESDVDRRLAAVRAAMSSANLDALLVYGDLAQSGDLAYLSNFHPFDVRMPGFALITGSSLEAVLKVSSRDLGFIAPFIWAPAQPSDFLANDLAGQVRDIVVKQELENKRVGLAGAALMPPGLLTGIKDIFAGGIVEAGPLMASLRRRKSESESAIVRAAAIKAEDAIEEICEHALGGDLSETELAAFADYAARKRGAQDVEILLHSQSDTIPPPGVVEHLPFRPTRDRLLVAGEPVGVFMALQYHGYWAELSQSVVAGKAVGKQPAALTAASDAFSDLGNVIGRPGASPPQLTCSWVHGIGLDREEEPHSGASLPSAADGDILAIHAAVQRDGIYAFYGRTVMCAAGAVTTLAMPLSKSA